MVTAPGRIVRALFFVWGIVSPLRRRVTLPTAAKSPKRRLETKVSKNFLCHSQACSNQFGAGENFEGSSFYYRSPALL